MKRYWVLGIGYLVLGVGTLRTVSRPRALDGGERLLELVQRGHRERAVRHGEEHVQRAPVPQPPDMLQAGTGVSAHTRQIGEEPIKDPRAAAQEPVLPHETLSVQE